MPPLLARNIFLLFNLFIDFCLDLGEDPLLPSDFDDLINDFIHHLYMTEAGKSRAHDTVYGILMLLPELKGHLPVLNLVKKRKPHTLTHT